MQDPKVTTAGNRKAVYTIIQREGHKPRWLRIGIAFVNRDGSYNVMLDALPVNGELHIRDFPPSEAEPGAAIGPTPASPPEAEGKTARRAPRASAA